MSTGGFMKTLEPGNAVSGKVNRFVDTGAADERSLGSIQPLAPQDQERWQAVIDHQLVEWGRDSSQLEDEGIVAPTAEIIGLACRLAALYRDTGMVAPTRVVPDGEGGIVFERRDGSAFQTIEIRADHTIEWCYFVNSRLVDRRPLPLVA